MSALELVAVSENGHRFGEREATDESVAERRYLAIHRLSSELAVASDWEECISCLRSVLNPANPPPARLWRISSDGPREFLRAPAGGEFGEVTARELESAIHSAGPVTTSQGAALIGLRWSDAALAIIEVSNVADVDLELVWRCQSLLGPYAALLSSVDAVGLSAFGCDRSGEGAAIRAFAGEVKEQLAHDRLSVYLLTRDGRSVERIAVETSAPLEGESRVVSYSDFGLRRVLLSNQPLVSHDLAADERIVGREDRIIAQAGFHGLLSVPLRLDGHPIGVMNFVSRRRGFYSEVDAALGQQIADQVSPFIVELRYGRRPQALIRQSAASEERARVARDMHAAINRRLLGLAERAQQLADGADTGTETAAEFRDLATAARQIIVEAERAYAQLTPHALETATFEEVICAELGELRDRLGVDVTCAVDSGVDSLPSSVMHALYRIVREVLDNVSRHAAPDSVSVELEIGSELVLTVSDDGSGFSQSNSSTSAGLGLRCVHDFAEALGGTLTIETAPGCGTTVRLELIDPTGNVDPAIGRAQVSDALAPTGVAVRVLIVESHPLLLAGLTTLLEREADIRVVARLARPAEVHRQVVRLRPDVVLLDADSDPDVAATTAREVARSVPSAALVALSDRGSAIGEAMRELGVVGVLSKALNPAALVDAVRAVAAGGQLDAPQTAREGVIDVQLSGRERMILQLVATGRTNAEIGRVLHFSTKTIERRVATVVDKVGARNRAHAAALAVSSGLVSVDDISQLTVA